MDGDRDREEAPVRMKTMKTLRNLFPFVLIAAPLLGQRSQVESYLAKKYSDDAPGCVVAVVKDGKVLGLYARGVAEVGTQHRLGGDSRFYLASVSKQFTATCIHLLVRDEKLSLDDDVRKYVPELPDYGHPITVRHLIHHRSGLRDYFELMVFAKMDVKGSHSSKAVLELVCRQKALNFRPGSEFLYSNSGYLVMAEIVARVSGKSIREFAKERLFGPAGMKHTCFRDVPGEEIENAVLGHDATGDGHRAHRTKFHLVGSGGVVAPATDLVMWVSTMNNAAFVDQAFVRSLETPIALGATDGRSPSLGHYAAGWIVSELGGRLAVWHAGGSLGFSTCVLRFPGEKFSVIVLCNSNRGNARKTAFDIAELHLGKKVKQGAEVTSAAPARPRDGRFLFRHPHTNELMVSIVRGDKLKLAVAAWDVKMRPTNATSMQSIGTAIPVSASFVYRDNAPADLRVTIGKQAPFLCKGLAAERVAPEAIADVAGKWRSEEVGASLELAPFRGGMKIVDQLQIDPGPLYAMQRDLLVTNDGFVIQVERDDAGKAIALRVSSKGARGIRYTK